MTCFPAINFKICESCLSYAKLSLLHIKYTYTCNHTYILRYTHIHEHIQTHLSAVDGNPIGRFHMCAWAHHWWLFQLSL